MLDLLKPRLIAYLFGIVAALIAAALFAGYAAGIKQCNAKHEAAANKSAIEQINADFNLIQSQAEKSAKAGATLAANEQTIQTRTQYLTKEVIKYVPTKTSSNDCSIGVDSVRIWNEANSGDDIKPVAAPEYAHNANAVAIGH